jgi:acetyl esterase/lipase
MAVLAAACSAAGTPSFLRKPNVPEREHFTACHRLGRSSHHAELRVVKPYGQCKGIYLDFHGGAWAIGRCPLQDRVNSAIAAECQMVVASVEYRLARDDRIRPSDALAATGWILENMRNEFGVDRAVLGGESSGAHLAACALTALSDRQADLSSVAGAVLFYGTYGMAGTPSLRNSSAESLLCMVRPPLTSGMDDAQRRSPWLSPLFCDLAGLPAALFFVGEPARSWTIAC